MVSSYGLPWQNSFAIIVLLYFYSHYLFASGAAHIGAMYTAFLSVAIACGTPGLLAAVALGQVHRCSRLTPCTALQCMLASNFQICCQAGARPASWLLVAPSRCSFATCRAGACMEFRLLLPRAGARSACMFWPSR